GSRLGRMPEHAITVYQTLNSFVIHLVTADARWHPVSVFDIPVGWAIAASYMVNSAFIFFFLFRIRDSIESDSMLSYGAAVALGIVTSPLAEDYHYLLFIPLIVGLYARHFLETHPGVGGKQLTFAVCLILIALPW